MADDDPLELFEELIQYWGHNGVSCPQGVTETDLRLFESQHGIVLPSDLRLFYSMIDGMGERGTYDDDFFSFWSLQDLVSIEEHVPDRAGRFPNSSDYNLIADHSVGLPSFAIRLSSIVGAASPIASLFTDNGALVIQDYFTSFTDFVKQYLNDPFGTITLLPENI